MLLSALLFLPLLVAADQQPLKDIATGWLDKAKAFMDGAAASPIDAGAAKVADMKVTKINRRNWERILTPKVEGAEEWLVYATGGNKSCFGKCGLADEQWNLSVPLITALPSHPHLGFIDCEKEDVLCTAWSALIPSLWHFDFPQKPLSASTPTPPTPLRIVPVNMTTVTAQDILSVVTEKQWEEQQEYAGSLHPIDGFFAKYGLLMPLGWFLWGFGSTPSWLIMIGISFFSRQYMAKKTQSAPGFGAGAGGVAPPAAAPAPAQPAPGGARAGGKKRK